MDLIQQMTTAERMTRMLVAELRAGGLDPVSIAAPLSAAAGNLYREGLAPEQVPAVVNHMAKLMITGKPQ